MALCKSFNFLELGFLAIKKPLTHHIRQLRIKRNAKPSQEIQLHLYKWASEDSNLDKPLEILSFF